MKILAPVSLLLIILPIGCASTGNFWDAMKVEEAFLEYEQYQEANLETGMTYVEVVDKIGYGIYEGQNRDGGHLFTWHSQSEEGGIAVLIFSFRGQLKEHFYVGQ